MSPDIALLTLVIATPVALAVAIFDLRYMEIPNRLTVGAFALFAALVFTTLPLDDALWRLGGAGLTLAVCFAMFATGAMGGGDAKAATAFAMLIAPVDAGVVLIMLSVIAIASLCVIVTLKKVAFSGGQWAVWRAERRFPYGVALGLTLIVYLALVARTAGAI